MLSAIVPPKTGIDQTFAVGPAPEDLRQVPISDPETRTIIMLDTKNKTAPLGGQFMEGIEAEGTRANIESERWLSPERHGGRCKSEMRCDLPADGEIGST
jgi:hypothetical protein